MASVVLSAAVSSLAVGIYDVTVRQPRTPRLAVVDIARVFAAAERQAKQRVAGIQPRSSAMPAELAAMGELSQFGSAAERAMKQLADECGCVIVAMAAVVGEAAAVPDYTSALASRLGVVLGAGHVPAPNLEPRP